MDVIIVGAGIAGLTAAYHLKRKGLSLLILEKSPRYGGHLHSVRQNGCLLEKGPHSFLGSQETIWGHIDLLKLQEEVIQAKPSAKNRFILSLGKLNPFPKTPLEFLKTPLLSTLGKLRLLIEPWVSSQALNGEESVAQFVTRRLGKEALHLVEPMIHGIYVGNSQTLSLQAIAPKLALWEKEYGSLFKALKKSRLLSQGQVIYSFKNGMQTLPNALYQRVQEDCHLECREIGVTKQKEDWVVSWKHRGTPYTERASSLILGTPAYEASHLLKRLDPDLSLALDAISYAPIAVIHLLVDKKSLSHPLNGFGFLSGAGEDHFLLGSLWSSSIFEGRSLDSQILFTCYAGGAKNGEALDGSDDCLLSKTLEELRHLFGQALLASEAFVTRHPHGLPQYTLGHVKRLEKIKKGLAALDNLYLVGNYLEGISVNDTMRRASQTAKEISHVAGI